ncbi:MAG: hypothetical protein WCK73_18110 [Deltaproteobacteria bacterium]
MTSPGAPRVAVIDVGSNTVLLTVAERRGATFAPVVERARSTYTPKPSSRRWATLMQYSSEFNWPI